MNLENKNIKNIQNNNKTNESKNDKTNSSKNSRDMKEKTPEINRQTINNDMPAPMNFAAVVGAQPSTSASSLLSGSGPSMEYLQTKHTIKGDNTTSEKNDGFITVTNKRNPRKYRKSPAIIGKGNDKSNGKLLGAIRRSWLYVGHIVNKDATAEDMSDYLVNSFEGSNPTQFVCKKLNTLGNCSAFKVGIPQKFLNDVKNAEFWTEGVVIRDFDFSKKPNSSQPKQNENFQINETTNQIT